MLTEELEMSELYNPSPGFANTTGDVPGREIFATQQNPDGNDFSNSMKDLYEV